MGAPGADIWPWLWLVVGSAAGVTAIAVTRWRLAAIALALGGLAAGLVGFASAAATTQAAVAAAGSAVLFVVLVRYRSLVRYGSGLPPGTGGARLVGTTGVVTRASGGSGTARVRVLGDEWRVAGDTSDLAVGDRVQVTAVEGTTLSVEAQSPPDPGATHDDDAHSPDHLDGVT